MTYLCVFDSYHVCARVIAYCKYFLSTLMHSRVSAPVSGLTTHFLLIFNYFWLFLFISDHFHLLSNDFTISNRPYLFSILFTQIWVIPLIFTFFVFTSAKHLATFWYLWLTWSSWEQYKHIQESPQEPYKLITLYLGATCTSENILFKLGLLTFYLLFGPFLAWFWVNILKRKLKWVQVI